MTNVGSSVFSWNRSLRLKENQMLGVARDLSRRRSVIRNPDPSSSIRPRYVEDDTLRYDSEVNLHRLQTVPHNLF